MGIALILAVSVLAGCGSSSSKANSSSTTTTSAGASFSGTTIHVTLGDTTGLSGPETLVATPVTAPAGDVTFVVKNAGTIDHEMLVLTTPPPFDQIPVADAGDPPAPATTGANKIDEANSLGETGDPNLKPGTTRTFTVKNMTAGTYALVCNIADHYMKGMRAAFTVN